MKYTRNILCFILFFSPLWMITNIARAQSGTLDLSFDADGIVITNITGSCDVAKAIALQSDGKIILAGGANNSIGLVRYNSDGSLDNTFDNDGKVFTSFNNYSIANSISIQNDGKIVVGGCISINGTNDFSLVRYNSDGSLDYTFDQDGIVTTTMSIVGSSIIVGSSGNALIIQPDNKILLAGDCGFAASQDFGLTRYNPDGSLDITFDFDGKLNTNIGAQDDCNAMDIQNDGKIVLAGNSQGWPSNINSFALARYNNNGSLDYTFDSDGIVTTQIENYTASTINSIKIQDIGKIIVAGAVWNPATSISTIVIARYNINGSLDVSFDYDGIITKSIGSHDMVFKILEQPDEKILVAGLSNIGNNSNFLLLRLNSNGSMDSTFNSNGIVLTDFGGSDLAFTMALQSDGKILVAGGTMMSTTCEFALARYNNTVTVGIEESHALSTNLIFPVPSTGLFIIPIDNSTELVNLIILNSKGQIVFETSTKNEQSLVLDLTTQPKGLYYLEIWQGVKTRRIKLVKN